jgi:uncharacterized peroxidase-related enzyme
VVHHGAGLRRALRQEGRTEAEIAALIDGLERDAATVPVAALERTMLDYALKLTATPWQVRESDIAGLRAVGFDDRAVHDLCAITAYFAFVNRIADGLGVELEPRFGEREQGGPA